MWCTGCLAPPRVIAVIYLIFLGSIFVHGLFIWENPVQRGIALLTGVLIVLITAIMLRRGAFAPRTVVQLRPRTTGETGAPQRDPGGAGTPRGVRGRISRQDCARNGCAGPPFPTSTGRASSIWHCQPDKRDSSKCGPMTWKPEGEAIGMAVELEVRQGSRNVQLRPVAERWAGLVVPIEDRPYDLTVKFTHDTGNSPEAGSGG